MSASPDAGIVAVDRFILATRDSGYRGTPSAVAELVDNAIQARARSIWITVDRDPAAGEWPLELTIQDDGVGMCAATLRQALRFGGSTRFGDRSGLGRYGMGLPNSSLSQARRVDVLSWRGPRSARYSYLDVDEISRGDRRDVPPPVRATLRRQGLSTLTRSGTRITWRRCDRLDHKRPSTIQRHLRAELGRVFRHFIWGGLNIQINGEPVVPIDPLFLNPTAIYSGATGFGEPLHYEMRAPTGELGRIEVRFAELPVADWHDMRRDEKRARGILSGAGVSVVRGGREVDRGWFFMGAKRRENYDNWWRSEVRFDPVLDEHFGITHTKQTVRPSGALIDLLSSDLEAAARALNARARRAHEQAKMTRRLATAERRATVTERRLQSVSLRPPTPDEASTLRRLEDRFPGLSAGPNHEGLSYRLVIDALPSTRAFEVLPSDSRLVVALNASHPFYKKIYEPLLHASAGEADVIRCRLDLLVLAAARSEVACQDQRAYAEAHRQRWSDILSEFLKDEAGG